MNEYQRLDYLIKVLSGNNARAFALKAGIRPDVLSRVRNGKGNPSFYFERILGAFPTVSRDWLYTGDGAPLMEEREKSEVIARLEALENAVRLLAAMVERLAEKS